MFRDTILSIQQPFETYVIQESCLVDRSALVRLAFPDMAVWFEYLPKQINLFLTC